MSYKYCIFCGAPIAKEAVFCAECGKRQIAVDEAPVEQSQNIHTEAPTSYQAPHTEAPKPKRKLASFPLAKVIRNSVLLLVSLIMLVRAFCPLFTYNQELLYQEVEVGYSASDGIILLFDSFANLDEEEIKETDLHERYKELYSKNFWKIFRSEEELTDSEEKTMRQLVLLAKRLDVKADTFAPTASFYAFTILSLVYILNAIALFAFALFNLLASLGRLGNSEKPMLKWTVRALSLTPVTMIATYYCLHFSQRASYDLSDNAINILALSLTAIISMLIIRIVLIKDSKVHTPIARSIASTLAVVVILLSFAPIFTSAVTTLFDESSKESTATIYVKPNHFESYVFDDETRETLEEMYDTYTTEQKKSELSSWFDRFDNNTKKDVENGAADNINDTILVYLWGMKIPIETIELLPLISLLFIGALIGATLILWQNLSYFANNQYSTKIVILGKILSATFATLALTVSCIYLFVVQSLQDTYLPAGYDISISGGVIFLALFAFGSIFCPHNVGPRVTKNNIEEPVVSYETTIE